MNKEGKGRRERRSFWTFSDLPDSFVLPNTIAVLLKVYNDNLYEVTHTHYTHSNPD